MQFARTEFDPRKDTIPEALPASFKGGKSSNRPIYAFSGPDRAYAEHVRVARKLSKSVGLQAFKQVESCLACYPSVKNGGFRGESATSVCLIKSEGGVLIYRLSGLV